MRCDSFVTLWHFDEETGRYRREIYPARVYFEGRLSKSGVKQDSFYSGARGFVRIPASFGVKVSLGDYIRRGRCFDAGPDRIEDLKVSKITDNRFGHNPHIKIFCGRASERS
ncbi:MAG: hypothetical protein E7417_01980 [Ruminococcaceae bacterium]|nr:hypothetical protein [Oscillospiraceae bacterium]